MKDQIDIIEEALQIIKDNPKHREVRREQCNLIIKYAKELKQEM